MYPNPARDQVTLEGLKGDAVIEVYNSEGKLVDTWMSSKDKHSFSLDGLAAGLYILHVRDENGDTIFKMLKTPQY
jgi:Secretion system C-terminal sorting domain